MVGFSFFCAISRFLNQGRPLGRAGNFNFRPEFDLTASPWVTRHGGHAEKAARSGQTCAPLFSKTAWPRRTPSLKKCARAAAAAGARDSE